MAEPSDDEIDRALRRGEAVRLFEPRAASVRYEPRASRVVVELTNGCTFIFPPRSAQGLTAATDEDLMAVSVLGSGYGLHWDRLDVDLAVPELLAGRFGTRAYMDETEIADDPNHPTHLGLTG